MTPTKKKQEYERLRTIQKTTKDESLKLSAKEKADIIYSEIRFSLD